MIPLDTTLRAKDSWQRPSLHAPLMPEQSVLLSLYVSQGEEEHEHAHVSPSHTTLRFANAGEN